MCLVNISLLGGWWERWRRVRHAEQGRGVYGNRRGALSPHLSGGLSEGGIKPLLIQVRYNMFPREPAGWLNPESNHNNNTLTGRRVRGKQTAPVSLHQDAEEVCVRNNTPYLPVGMCVCVCDLNTPGEPHLQQL